MPKKKSRKAAKKTIPPQPAAIEEVDAGALAGENQNVESDAPPTARRSMEANNDVEGGDVERLAE